MTKWYALYVSTPVWFWPVKIIETESKWWFLWAGAEKNGKLFRETVSVLQSLCPSNINRVNATDFPGPAWLGPETPTEVRKEWTQTQKSWDQVGCAHSARAAWTTSQNSSGLYDVHREKERLASSLWRSSLPGSSLQSSWRKKQQVLVFACTGQPHKHLCFANSPLCQFPWV